MPKGLPWFRLYSEFAFDPKMQTISETLQRRYIMLLCLKCHGDLPGLNDVQLSGALRISIEELHETHKILLSLGIITENYDIPKWSERQYISDHSSIRVKKYREKKNETLLKRKCNGNVTPPDTDTDTDSEQIQKKEKNVKKNFIRPTSEELLKYILDNKYSVDPDSFLDYYETRGWMLGKVKMKNWQAAVRTWERNNKNKPNKEEDWIMK
jgi:hypothetical protein